MRQYGPSSSRADPTDRNPSNINQGSTINPLVLGPTTVATYTVPAGRRARVQITLSGAVLVALAAGQNVQIYYQDNAGNAPVRIWFPPTAPAATMDSITSGVIYLAAGIIAQIFSTISAGAGSATGGGLLSGVEYDV